MENISLRDHRFDPLERQIGRSIGMRASYNNWS